MAKKAASAQDAADAYKPSTVTISIDTAEKLLELFSNIEAADAHFKSCQHVLFRQHVRSVYQAPNIDSAYRALRSALEAVKGE